METRCKIDAARILSDAYVALHRAQERVHNAMIDCLPVGSCVTWVVNRGDAKYAQFGVVVRHGYGDTLFVKNIDTGKLRRFTAQKVCIVSSDGKEQP
jgi:hypothetical protein